MASPPSIELSWSAPPICPGKEVVLRAIQDLIGETSAAREPTQFWIRGDVEARDGNFLLNLSWRSAAHHAERTMTAKTCDELARAAALIVALAVNPERVEPAPPAPATSAPPSAATNAPPPPETRVLPSQPLDSHALPGRQFTAASEQTDRFERPGPGGRAARVRARAEMGTDIGALPRAAVGLGLGLSIPINPIILQSEAFVFGPQTRSIEGGGGGKFWMGALALRPCLSWGHRLRVLPCASSELALLYGKGQGLDFRQGGAAWFLRLGGGGEVAYALSRGVGMVAGLWFLAAPFRPNFVVEESVQVHRPARFGGRTTLGLELKL